VRREATKALEIARKEKRIGHSLDASISLVLPTGLSQTIGAYRDQLRTIFIVSSVDLVDHDDLEEAYESEEIAGLKVRVRPSEDPKCERCWVHDPTVGDDDQHPTVCRRCLDAMIEAGYLSQ